MRRFFLSAVMAVLLSSVLALPAAAQQKEWCTSDPIVRVAVDGKPVIVHVIVSVPLGYSNLLHTARASGEVRGNTIIVTLVGPDAPFKAYARIKNLGLSAGDLEEIYDPREKVRFEFERVNPDLAIAAESEVPVTLLVNGQPVTANVFVSVPVGYASALSSVQVSGDVTDDTVRLTLVGPDAPFRAYAQIWNLGLSAGKLNKRYDPGESVRLTFKHMSK